MPMRPCTDQATANAYTPEFTPLAPQSLTMSGPLGKALDITIKNRLKEIDYQHLTQVFTKRQERDLLWRCEFWGKIIRSAIYGWRYSGDKKLLATIRQSVQEILDSQTPDGCISSYPEELQLQGWDIWGRKYVLLGLTRYYQEVEADPRVLSACQRMLDHFIDQVKRTGKELYQMGYQAGLPASSILGAVVKTYNMTKDPKHLEFARWIVKSGSSVKHNIFQAADAGVPPAEIGNGKAYELTACFEGLLELYKVDPQPQYLQTVLRFWEMVRNQEIFITGVGGLMDAVGEFFYYGAMRQTRDDSGMLGETCVTVTWIRFCTALLQVTGRADIADELERACYNGLLGAMRPDGRTWTHSNPTPLAGGKGYKRAADDQICGFGQDCCLAQGPEGLGNAPLNAIMTTRDGLAINFYENCTCHTTLANGVSANIAITGNFPYKEKARVVITLSQNLEFTLRLRIPQWWQNSYLTINGKRVKATPGEYLKLKRCWDAEILVEINFDMSLRAIISPDLSCTAVMRGPLVLARDERLSALDTPLSLPLSGRVMSKREKPEEVALAVELADGSILCDYASAGNAFSCDDRINVWMKNTDQR